MALTCDMRKDCPAPVTMIDQDGFAYCTDHGLQRRNHQPCRKLRTSEVRKLERGEQLRSY